MLRALLQKLPSPAVPHADWLNRRNVSTSLVTTTICDVMHVSLRFRHTIFKDADKPKQAKIQCSSGSLVLNFKFLLPSELLEKKRVNFRINFMQCTVLVCCAAILWHQEISMLLCKLIKLFSFILFMLFLLPLMLMKLSLQRLRRSRGPRLCRPC